MNILNTLQWLAASRLSGIGSVTFLRWLELFDNRIDALFSASERELAAAGLNQKHIYSVQHPPYDIAEQDLAWCNKNQCELIPYNDPRYPTLLHETMGPPLILYIQGEVNLLNESQLAIVGSRHPSNAGRECAHAFAGELVRAGLHITSGLAFGIDAASHRGALHAQGKTLAVCGTGLNTIYPASHIALAEEIKQHGALISEFSPNEYPRAQNFPRRNRIISGLSLGVLVVEAALRSGSLITARYATEQGRDVFAIPGSIQHPLARGCHHLIRQGAKLVETAQDIIEELGCLAATRKPASSIISSEPRGAASHSDSLSAEERALLAHIDHSMTPLDMIILRSGLTASKVSSMLLSLELQGHLQAVRGGYQLI